MNIQELIDELQEAQKSLEHAERCVSIARNEECTALNRVNNAQKAVDEALQDIRKKSPRRSNWKRREDHDWFEKGLTLGKRSADE